MLYPQVYCLEATRPYLPAALVSASALAHILDIARDLPPATNQILECRLAPTAAGVDFVPRFAPFHGGAEFLAGSHAVIGFPNRFLTNHVWRRTRDFCRDWREPDSVFNGPVEDIWLEFDINGPAPAVPNPCIFVLLRTEDHPGRLSHAKLATVVQKQHRLIQAIIDFYLADTFTARRRQNLTRCFAAIPPLGGQAPGIGLMFSRTVEAVRFSVADMPMSRIVDYLTGVGWDGPSDVLRNVVADVSRFVDKIMVAFDVGDTIFPRIGLECYLLERNPRKESRWNLLLGHLVELGLCAPAKRDALLAWYGGHFHGPVQPAAGPRCQSVLVRHVSHVKLLFQPGQPLEAKAYLDLSQHWLTLP
jgi:hypothetical protein